MSAEDTTTEISKKAHEPLSAQRDPAFVRLSADVSFAANFEDDVDIALLQRQALYRNIMMGDDEQPESMDAAKTIVEVARLRMPVKSALLMSFNIFGACASAGILDLENFDMNVEIVRKEIRDAMDKESGDAA